MCYKLQFELKTTHYITHSICIFTSASSGFLLANLAFPRSSPCLVRLFWQSCWWSAMVNSPYAWRCLRAQPPLPPPLWRPLWSRLHYLLGPFRLPLLLLHPKVNAIPVPVSVLPPAVSLVPKTVTLACFRVREKTANLNIHYPLPTTTREHFHLPTLVISKPYSASTPDKVVENSYIVLESSQNERVSALFWARQ